MSDVTSFKVTGDWRHIVDDGMVDGDNLPDEVPLTGKVVFKPVYPTVATAGVPVTAYTLGPVTALIAGGVLNDLQGRPGVMLAGKVGEHTVRWSAETSLRFQEQKVDYPRVTFDLNEDVRLTGIITQVGPSLSPIVVDPRIEALAASVESVNLAVVEAEGHASTAAQQVPLAKAEADRAEGLAGAQDEHIAGTLEDPESATHAAFKAVGNATYGTKGEVEAVATDAAARVKITEAPLSPARYGAVGDGTTIDTVALNAAFTAARNAVNGQVRLDSARVYATNATLNPAGVSVLAHGATLRAAPGVEAANIIQANDAFTWAGGTLDGNKANNVNPGAITKGCGIYLYRAAGWANRAIIRDVNITNVHQVGVRIGTGSTAVDGRDLPASAALLSGVRVSGAGAFGYHVSNARDVLYESCTALDSGEDGFFSSLSSGTGMSQCRAENNNGHGIVALYAHNPRFVGCITDSNVEAGLALGGGSVTLLPSVRPVIVGHSSRNNGWQGITLDPRIAGSDVVQRMSAVVVGANCIGNTSHGLYVNFARAITVSGGEFSDNQLHGISYSAADTMTSGVLCSGNVQAGIKLNGNVTRPDFTRHRFGINNLFNNGMGGYVVEDPAYVTDVRWAATTATMPTS